MTDSRYLVKQKLGLGRDSRVTSLHESRTQAVHAAYFLNETYQTDEYYIEKYDESKVFDALSFVKELLLPHPTEKDAK